MPRISSEKAVSAIGNRYDMILIAAARMRELKRGDKPKVSAKFSDKSLIALQEIEERKIGIEYLNKFRK